MTCGSTPDDVEHQRARVARAIAAPCGSAPGLARVLLECDTVSRARQILGKTGEDLACRELERRGYAIVARRYRRRRGELDIIARDGPTLVFVEVKARNGSAFGEARDAITGFKRRRITRIARDYMMRHHLSGCPCRFDVVSVRFQSGEPAIEVIQNAFDA